MSRSASWLFLLAIMAVTVTLSTRSSFAQADAVDVLNGAHSPRQAYVQQRLMEKLFTGTQPAAPQTVVHTPDVLVVDFSGLNSEGPGRADNFKHFAMQGAALVSVGVSGRQIPDQKRGLTKYDIIVPGATIPDVVGGSAEKVLRLISNKNAGKTIVHFDFNEAHIPNQLKDTDCTDGQENKVCGPALLAARVIAEWKRGHPDGRVVLRGHSDGTWAALYILQAIRHVSSLHPLIAMVIIESPRQSSFKWMNMATHFSETAFMSIRASFDLFTENPFDSSFENFRLDNWTDVYIDRKSDMVKTISTGLLTDHRGLFLAFVVPFRSHGIVTDYSQNLAFTVSSNGNRYRTERRLGAYVAAEVEQAVSSKTNVGGRKVRFRTRLCLTNDDLTCRHFEAELSGGEGACGGGDSGFGSRLNSRADCKPPTETVRCVPGTPGCPWRPPSSEVGARKDPGCLPGDTRCSAGAATTGPCPPGDPRCFAGAVTAGTVPSFVRTELKPSMQILRGPVEIGHAAGNTKPPSNVQVEK